MSNSTHDVGSPTSFFLQLKKYTSNLFETCCLSLSKGFYHYSLAPHFQMPLTFPSSTTTPTCLIFFSIIASIIHTYTTITSTTITSTYNVSTIWIPLVIHLSSFHRYHFGLELEGSTNGSSSWIRWTTISNIATNFVLNQTYEFIFLHRCISL